MLKEFELVPHTADLKIRAYGIDLPELFCHALKGMFTSIKPQSSEITYKDDYPIIHHFVSERSVHTRSLDKETLLVDFLSDCLYLSDIHNEAYFNAHFSLLTETELEATIYGVTVTGFEVVEIKAVTYHDLELEQIDGIWQATIVFDI
jgi:SHS2 domain-containing protein